MSLQIIAHVGLYAKKISCKRRLLAKKLKILVNLELFALTKGGRITKTTERKSRDIEQ